MNVISDYLGLTLILLVKKVMWISYCVLGVFRSYNSKNTYSAESFFLCLDLDRPDWMQVLKDYNVLSYTLEQVITWETWDPIDQSCILRNAILTRHQHTIP